MNAEIRRRLMFIVHRAFVETRLLAQDGKNKQIFDLADAVEPIPGYIENWNDGLLEVIRSNLKGYREKYPSPSFDYVRYLDADPSPPPF